MSGAQTAFIQNNLPYASASSAATGLPLDVTLGISALETGWGSSAAYVSGNNPFGISNNEVPNSYPSLQAGYSAFTNLLSSPRYAGVNGNDPTSQIASALVGAGYNTVDPNYATNLTNVVGSVDAILNQNGADPRSYAGSHLPQQSASSQSGSSQNSASLGTIGSWLTSGAFAILAIVVLGVGLLMLARQGKLA